jgi:hypothetical protein
MYHQTDKNDYENLPKICDCLNLYTDEKNNAKGFYRGILRYSISFSNVIQICVNKNTFRFRAFGNDFILYGSLNEFT